MVRVEWAAEWSACLLEYAIGRSRSSTKEEAASPEAAAHVPGQAGHSLAGWRPATATEQDRRMLYH